MAPKPAVYYYRAIFPREWNAPRPNWPMTLLDDVAALPDVIDTLYPDLSVAWHPAGLDTEVRNAESRRRLVDFIVASVDGKGAEAARVAIRELVLELKTKTQAASVTFMRWQTDFEVL